MNVFVVLKAEKDNMSNDWDYLEYYTEFECIGVFTTLSLAAASIGLTSEKLEKTRLNDDTGASFGEGWKFVNKPWHYFIVQKTLIVV
jgi:hypothetical protein